MEPVNQGPFDFAGFRAEVVAVAEACRLAHGQISNSRFATKTSSIDQLPDQRIALQERMI